LNLTAPAHLPAEFFFKLCKALVAEKNHSGIPVILQGQIPAEGSQLPALDAVEFRFGNEIGTDDLLPNTPGVNDCVQKLTLIRLHKRIASLSVE
jgi:hypothetical protein